MYLTQNGWKFVIAILAVGFLTDKIMEEYRIRTEDAKKEQEHYDREFSLIAENYASE